MFYHVRTTKGEGSNRLKIDSGYIYIYIDRLEIYLAEKEVKDS